MKLFIGSLPYNITEPELSALCSPFGDVVSANLIVDQFTGQSKGFGFVEMSSRSEGHKVMDGLNGKEYNHRTLVCNEAKPPAKKGQRRRLSVPCLSSLQRICSTSSSRPIVACLSLFPPTVCFLPPSGRGTLSKFSQSNIVDQLPASSRVAFVRHESRVPTLAFDCRSMNEF